VNKICFFILAVYEPYLKEASPYHYETSQLTSITDKQKTVWRDSLLNIETFLDNMNKGKIELRWAWNILEDRKEEFDQLILGSQASVEEVNAFTESLQAL
jgi:hypothetical protein